MQEAEALLELQSIDIEIMRANKRLEELPEKRAILEVRAKQREVGAMREKAELLVRKLESEIKARQDEVTLLNDKIAAEQTKIMSTTDHRQVQSLTREMDGLRRRVDKLEMESMQFMERSEKAQAQVATIGDALSQLADKEAGLIDRFKSVGGELQQEIAKLEAKRIKLAATLSAETLRRYEAARAAKGGVGVGRLENDTCTACRMALPAERVRDLTNGDDIGVCPQCRRLIVVRTGASEEGE